jgi:3-hydroxyacyl-[acyl-carrier-protein] dehydratase
MRRSSREKLSPEVLVSMDEKTKSADKRGETLIYPMYLDGEAIKQFIPHRDAMLFAKNVTVLDHDHYLGEAVWAANSFVFQGHFPAQPIVPGVIILEAGAQIAGVGLLAGDPVSRASVRGNIGLLAGIRKCFFRRPVPPGLTLTFDLRIRHVVDDVVNVTGEVSCELGNVASLEFVFAQAPVETLAQNLGKANAV